MKKKIISICLALVIIFSCSVFANADNYEDIAGHWAEKAIYTWSDRGVINGVGNRSFAPNNDMTRAEAATVFAKLFKLEEKGDISSFSDVASNAWYKEAFEKCVAAGIIDGEGNKLNPNGKITREMFFTMLVRALNIETDKTLKKQINDANSISDWAKESVYTLVNNGYVNGLGENTIAPKNNINRASVLTLIDRLIANYATEDNALLRSHDKGISLVLADNVKVEKGFSGTILVKEENTQLLLTGASTDVKVLVVADNVTIKNATNGIEVKVSETSKNVTVNGERIAEGSTVNVKTQVIISGGVSGGGNSGGNSGVHSHSYSEEVTTKATCLTDGVKTFTCGCGHSYTEVIPKLSEDDQHTEGEAVRENIVAESCTSGGTYDEVVYCSVCEEELSRTTKTTEKLEHIPATAVKENEVAGTCKVKATYDEVVYCSVCGDEMTRTSKTGEYGDHKYTDGSCEHCGEDEPITEPAIRVSKVVANAGGTVDVTISVVNNPGISSAIFSLTYDNNVMTLTNAELQQSFGGIIAPLPNEVKSPVSFVWYDQNMRDNANNGTMLKLTFEISGDVETGEIYDIVVNYVPGNIINIDEQNVEFETFNGKITIE